MKKQQMIKFTTVFLLVAFLSQNISAQFDSEINQKIRNEGKNNSQIMKTIQVLTDVYGPRLTGSPQLKAAGEWAANQMKTWGFDETRLEPWDFGNVGWVNERASGFITSPVQDSLVFEVLAWTPSTKKAVKGQAFQLIIPTKVIPNPNYNPSVTQNNPFGQNSPTITLPPTQTELDEYFNGIKTQVKGKMVLIGNPNVIPVNINPQPKRLSDEQVRQRLNPNAPQTFPTPQPTPTPREGQLTFQQINEQLAKFLLDNKVAVRINDAGREHGQIRAFSGGNYDVKKAIPTVVMRNEDFGRISRLMANGSTVSLEFDIRNRIYPEGKTSYNTIGEITGTDKKDEVIMLGGHLDAWHSATGATDNAVGCAIMMEAARILKALGVKPRRTIRVALWSGEEQGLLGSLAYVKQHFGSFEEPKPFYEKFGGYFNIDSGTGKARGMSVFGPSEAATILRDSVKPFEDLGILGAINTRNRNIGGSDHTSFNNAGLPGIGVFQDPIEYGTHTWHTNLDTYERIIEDDVKASAIIIAAAVYNLAMRDELLPRYPKDAMPKLPNN